LNHSSTLARVVMPALIAALSAIGCKGVVTDGGSSAKQQGAQDGGADSTTPDEGMNGSCAGGCVCFKTPDACAAGGCTPESVLNGDSVGFLCPNEPMGQDCEVQRKGRCVEAGSPCGHPDRTGFDCDPWPSTGSFCCLPPDSGVD
jgi:hypothetical protein